MRAATATLAAVCLARAATAWAEDARYTFEVDIRLARASSCVVQRLEDAQGVVARVSCTSPERPSFRIPGLPGSLSFEPVTRAPEAHPVQAGAVRAAPAVVIPPTSMPREIEVSF